MSLFDKVEAETAIGELQQKLPGNGSPTPRMPNIADRVTNMEDRILQLERQNKDLRQGVEHLCKLLVEQVGLVI